MVQTQDIISVRKKLGLTQEKLAETLGVSLNTVSRWERGEVSPSAKNLAALEKLCAGADAPAKAPPEPAPPLKPASRRWTTALLCFGVICALLIGIMALAGVYSIRQGLDRENGVILMEELEGKEVREVPTMPIALHPYNSREER